MKIVICACNYMELINSYYVVMKISFTNTRFPLYTSTTKTFCSSVNTVISSSRCGKSSSRHFWSVLYLNIRSIQSMKIGTSNNSLNMLGFITRWRGVRYSGKFGLIYKYSNARNVISTTILMNWTSAIDTLKTKSATVCYP